MAVMINSMGGGSDLRGTVHLKEFKTDVIGELTEVVNLEGPGRLLFAFVTRTQNSGGTSYNDTSDNIFIEIIPDGDETKTLKKHGGDSCSSSSHLAVRPLMQTLSFPELSHDFALDKSTALDYAKMSPETVQCTSTRVLHSTTSGITRTFAGNVEGIADGVEDASVTLYPDGMFFDDSLVIRGRWGRSLTRDFNGVILAYQIFD